MNRNNYGSQDVHLNSYSMCITCWSVTHRHHVRHHRGPGPPRPAKEAEIILYFRVFYTVMYIAGMHAPPRPVGQGKGLPCPVKITKTCGAQRGKVDFNPLKFGRQLQGRIQFCPINICLTHKSVDLRTFLPRPVNFFLAPPRGLKAPPRASLIELLY